MTKTPELKSILKVINNVIVPIYVTLMILDLKLGDLMPESTFSVAMMFGVIFSVIILIIAKWSKTIEDSKSKKIQMVDSITSKIALTIIGVDLLFLIFWRR